MASSEFLKKVGLTPGKAILIAVLTIVFVAVLVFQFSGDGASPPPASTNRVVTNKAVSPSTTAKMEMNKKPGVTTVKQKPRAWPRLDSESVGQHDPFLTPQWAIVKSDSGPSDAQIAEQRKALAEKQKAFEQLKNDGVDAILLSEGGNVAIIGSRDVRVGDVLNGFRVAEINANGVILEEYNPQ